MAWPSHSTMPSCYPSSPLLEISFLCLSSLLSPRFTHPYCHKPHHHPHSLPLSSSLFLPTVFHYFLLLLIRYSAPSSCCIWTPGLFDALLLPVGTSSWGTPPSSLPSSSPRSSPPSSPPKKTKFKYIFSSCLIWNCLACTWRESTSSQTTGSLPPFTLL